MLTSSFRAGKSEVDAALHKTFVRPRPAARCSAGPAVSRTKRTGTQSPRASRLPHRAARARRTLRRRRAPPRRRAACPSQSGSCASTPCGARSRGLLQLLEDLRVLERRHVLLDLLALRDRAQQAPHDLARAGLGQVLAEADVLRLRDRADLLRDPLAQLFGDLLRLGTRRARTFEYDERADRFARELVGAANDRGLGHELRIGDERRLDLHRAESMARYVQHVVDAADDAEVALLVHARAVAGEIELGLEVGGPVGLLVALGVAPTRARHRRPGLADHQDPALAAADRVPGLGHDVGEDARQ